MRKVFLLLIFLQVASLAKAEMLTWADLQQNTDLFLARELKLNELSLAKDTSVHLGEISSLDIGVQVIDAQFSPCPPEVKDLRTEIEMVDKDYGLEVQPGCNISFYLEIKDLYRSSYFRQ